MAWSQDELAAMQAIEWWHKIDLGGVVTPGVDDSPQRLDRIQMPEDLSGRTVLDIGAWDGFYSFEAEKRGASRVVALDWHAWGHGGWGSKAGFDFAHRALDSSVEAVVGDALELDPARCGTFDVVLYLGVLYHMKNPMAALERVFSVTREMAIVETHAFVGPRRPMFEFFPGDELLGDSTNWFVPNRSALAGMLRAVGFKRTVEVAGPTNILWRSVRSMRGFVAGSRGPRVPLGHCRLVYHAYR